MSHASTSSIVKQRQDPLRARYRPASRPMRRSPIAREPLPMSPPTPSTERSCRAMDAATVGALASIGPWGDTTTCQSRRCAVRGSCQLSGLYDPHNCGFISEP